MRVTKVTYGMVRPVRQHATDRAEVEIDLDPDIDDTKAAFETARRLCDEALAAAKDNALRDKLRNVMSTDKGRADLERFLQGL
jgi:hypothetical protein